MISKQLFTKRVSTLTKFSDPTFALQAYHDYAIEKAKWVNEFLADCADLFERAQDQFDANFRGWEYFTSDSVTKADNWRVSHHLTLSDILDSDGNPKYSDDQILTLDKGYAKVGDVSRLIGLSAWASLFVHATREGLEPDEMNNTSLFYPFNPALNTELACIRYDDTYREVFLDQVVTIGVPVYKKDKSIVEFASFGTICENMLRSNHATLVTAYGAKAFTLADTVIGRVQALRDQLSSVFANAYTDDSSMLNYTVELLYRSEKDPTSFLTTLLADTAVEQIADESNTSVNDPSASPILAMTGASPVGSLASAATSVGQVVSAGFTVGAKVVAGVFKGLVSIGKSIFAPVKSFVTETLIDPKMLNYDASGVESFVDGFYVGNTGSDHAPLTYTITANDYGRAGLNLSAPDMSWRALRSLIGTTYAFNLIPAVFAIDVVDVTSSNSVPTSFNAGDTIYVKYKYRLKIKLNSYSGASSLDNLYGELKSGLYPLSLTATSAASGVQYSSIGFGHALNGISRADMRDKLDSYDTSGVVPLNNSSSNEEVIGSMINAIGLLSILSQSLDVNVGENAPVMPSVAYAKIPKALAGKFDNINVLSMICGQKPTAISEIAGASGWEWTSRYDLVPIRETGTLYNMRVTDAISTNSYTFSRVPLSYDDIVSHFIEIIIWQYMLKASDPLDYPFIPYCKGTYSWPAAKWQIRTDEENNQAVTNFMEKVFAAVLIITVTVAIGVAVKKVSNAILRKRIAKKAALDAKIRNGQPLTNGDLRKYRKFNGGASITKATSKGLLSSSSDDAEDIVSSSVTTGYAANDTTRSFKQITKLISGS